MLHFVVPSSNVWIWYYTTQFKTIESINTDSKYESNLSDWNAERKKNQQPKKRRKRKMWCAFVWIGFCLQIPKGFTYVSLQRNSFLNTWNAIINGNSRTTVPTSAISFIIITIAGYGNSSRPIVVLIVFV